jgi:hypothetical protein
MITQAEVQALVNAMRRYQEWRQYMAELREKQKYARKIRRKQQKEQKEPATA